LDPCAYRLELGGREQLARNADDRSAVVKPREARTEIPEVDDFLEPPATEDEEAGVAVESTVLLIGAHVA
ncbi:MAG: hypothetical protein ACK5MR_08395, partial [Cumulibacter sp.]